MNWEKYLNAERLRPSGRETQNDPRNEFESDFGRVIFSPAIRRMHDKTQVFPLTTDDNIHSRLTHSMEVMAIGHSLGIRLCEDKIFQRYVKRDLHTILREIPVLLKNSCLVHDIGNPPFGHFGEAVIQDYFSKLFVRKDIKFNLTEVEKEDFKKFDGNAQGFRVLTKLQVLDDPFGLNLTYATLASYVKYPNTGAIDKNI
jgi:dGTPase